ncbi:MAG: ATP-dependent helicase [Propionibacteriaceae bacterium]
MSTHSLSEEQRAAATAPTSHLMVLAPPGCGKTELLAFRAAHLIPNLLANQQILALTFTNRARANLNLRLREVLGVARMRRFVTVRNFHGHATELILAHGRTVGLRPDLLTLPRTSTLSRALAATGADAALRSAAEALLAKVKRQPLSDEEVLAEIAERANNPGYAVALDVEEARQAANQLHYDDLLRHAQRILQNPTVAHLYQCHYGAILVDEFQDMSEQQLHLVQHTCAGNRTYAGDPAQGIFTWAGAAPVLVEAALREECGTPLRLRESYRSSPSVLAIVNQISADIGGTADLVAAQPDCWPEGGCSARLEFPDKNLEASGVHELAAAILQATPDASIGIICRAAWRRTEIDSAFRTSGLPVRRWDFSVDDPATLGLIRDLATRLPRGATVQDARDAALASADQADVDTKEQLEDAFDVLMQTTHPTIRAALQEIRITDPREPVGPGVHLLNGHTGKGQQFDWVVVVGLEEGHIPGRRATSDAELAEEERTLLVMLSRARHGVAVTRVTSTMGKFGPYRPSPSRWWRLLGAQHASLSDVLDHVSRL